jgi:hypothetical protein
MKLAALTDNQLLSTLTEMVVSERKLVVQTVLYLIEVEDRRLHLKLAYSSVFDFCRRRLGFSEGEAFRRMTAARLVRRFPSLLARLERGELHLSGLALLRNHLTDANHEELANEASNKSKREIEELLARRAPKPDVPATIRQLPSPRLPAASVEPSLPTPSFAGPTPPSPLQSPPPAPLSPAVVPPSASPRPSPPPRLEPLAPERYKLQFTASSELKAKLERAIELLRHQNPSGDFAYIFEKALDALLTNVEKTRVPNTTRPQKPRASKRGHVPAATRRKVFARDGEQCSFRDAAGNRCPERAFLQLNHIEERALGGSDDADNLESMCFAHNKFLAEQTFGRKYIEHKIHMRQRKSSHHASSTCPPTAHRSAGEKPPSLDSPTPAR